MLRSFPAKLYNITSLYIENFVMEFLTKFVFSITVFQNDWGDVFLKLLSQCASTLSTDMGSPFRTLIVLWESGMGYPCLYLVPTFMWWWGMVNSLQNHAYFYVKQYILYPSSVNRFWCLSWCCSIKWNAFCTKINI